MHLLNIGNKFINRIMVSKLQYTVLMEHDSFSH